MGDEGPQAGSRTIASAGSGGSAFFQIMGKTSNHPLGYAAGKTGKNDLGISGCRLQLHSQTHSSTSISISLAMHALVWSARILFFVVSMHAYYTEIHTSQRLLPNVLYQAVARDSETAASRIDVIDDVHLFVRLFVCLSPKCKKTRFSQKLSNLELWCLLTTYKVM